MVCVCLSSPACRASCAAAVTEKLRNRLLFIFVFQVADSVVNKCFHEQQTLRAAWKTHTVVKMRSKIMRTHTADLRLRTQSGSIVKLRASPATIRHVCVFFQHPARQKSFCGPRADGRRQLEPEHDRAHITCLHCTCVLLDMMPVGSQV